MPTGQFTAADLAQAPSAPPQTGQYSAADLAQPAAGTPTYAATATATAPAPAPQDRSVWGEIGHLASVFDKEVGSNFEGGAEGLLHPIQSYLADTGERAKLLDQAGQDWHSGNYGSAAVHTLDGLVPFIGPLINREGDELTSGNPEAVTRGIADLVSLKATPEAFGLAGDAVKGAVPTVARAAQSGADALRTSAEKNIATALHPATKINKALTQNHLAQGLVDRGVVATSLKSLQEQAQTHVQDLGSQIDEAFDRHAAAGTKISPQPILDKLEEEKQSYTVDGIPINDAYVKRLGDLQQQVQDVADANGGEIPLSSLRRIRQIHDEQIAKSKGGFALAPDAQSAVDALKTYSDAIRSTIADTDPELAGINKEFSFWKNADKVAGDSLLRKTGQRSPLTQRLLEGAGTAAGAAMGGWEGALIGKEAGSALGRLQYSTLWNTLSAQAKSKIANLLGAGDTAGAARAAAEEGHPEIAGLLEAAPVRMPAVPDESGATGRVPQPGAGISPGIGNRMLAEPSQIQVPGFAAGTDLVPVRDPESGQYVYVTPEWAQAYARTAGTERAIASEPGSVAEEEHGAAGARIGKPDLGSAEGAPAGGVLAAGGLDQSAVRNEVVSTAAPPGQPQPQPLSGAQREAQQRFAQARGRTLLDAMSGLSADEIQARYSPADIVHAREAAFTRYLDSDGAAQIPDGLEDAESAPESGRAKLMRPFSDVPFDELDPNLTKEDVFRNSQVFYRPGPAGYKGVVYVNGHARDILTHVGRAHTDNDWEGLWLPGPAAKRVMQRLETAITKDHYGIDSVKPFYELRQALAQSIHDTGGALIVDAGHGQTFGNVRDTLRHELHHAHETDLPPEAAREFLKNPLAQVAKKALRARGYPNDPVELASEIGAHLQGDPNGAALRLSPKEAELLWKRYAQYHPGELQFDWMHPKLREAAREASQGKSAVLGKPGTPGKGSP